MSELLDLAARCEAAEGPDRELDQVIRCACPLPHEANLRPAYRGHRVVAEYEDGKPVTLNTPAYTASLDAAMALVPEGCQMAIYTNFPLCERTADCPHGPWPITDETPRGCYVRCYGDGPARNVSTEAATPALALCAAALRARACTSSPNALPQPLEDVG